MDLQVLCMNGEGLTLRIPCNTFGQEVRKMVSEKLPPKPGAKLVLTHGDSELLLHQTLQRQQGIVGQDVTLSCTFVPTNVLSAWCFVQEYYTSEQEFALEGITRLKGVAGGECLYNLPKCIESLRLLLGTSIVACRV